MTTYLCTDCPERCILKDSLGVTCSKWKDRLWFHPEEILCRHCKNIAVECYECTREPTIDQVKEIHQSEDWQRFSILLYESWKQRNPNGVKYVHV